MKFKQFLMSLPIIASMLLCHAAFAAATQFQSFNIKLVNYSGHTAHGVTHSIDYKTDLSPAQTSGAVAGTILPEGSSDITPWRESDEQTGMAANLEITNPLASNEVIFKAQIYYDAIDGRIVLFIMKSDEHYIVIPDIRNKDATYPAAISIAVYDQDPMAGQTLLQK